MRDRARVAFAAVEVLPGHAFEVLVSIERHDSAARGEIDVGAALDALDQVARHVRGQSMAAALALMIVLALADYLFQRMQFTMQNRMSRKGPESSEETKASVLGIRHSECACRRNASTRLRVFRFSRNE